MENYHAYYHRQAQGGGGLSGYHYPVYQGLAVQSGHGLGNILSAAFRLISPVLKSAGKAVLKQGASAGAKIVGDVLEGQSLKQAARQRAVEGGKALMNRAAFRSGLIPPPKKRKTVKKRSKVSKRRQSGKGRGRVKKSSGLRVLAAKRKSRGKKKKRKVALRDIFG